MNFSQRPTSRKSWRSSYCFEIDLVLFIQPNLSRHCAVSFELSSGSPNQSQSYIILKDNPIPFSKTPKHPLTHRCPSPWTPRQEVYQTKRKVRSKAPRVYIEPLSTRGVQIRERPARRVTKTKRNSIRGRPKICIGPPLVEIVLGRERRDEMYTKFLEKLLRKSCES